MINELHQQNAVLFEQHGILLVQFILKSLLQWFATFDGGNVNHRR